MKDHPLNDICLHKKDFTYITNIVYYDDKFESMGKNKMTPTETLLFTASRLRDLIESRVEYGPDDDLMTDIEDAYQDFVNADLDEIVELDAEEDAINDN